VVKVIIRRIIRRLNFFSDVTKYRTKVGREGTFLPQLPPKFQSFNIILTSSCKENAVAIADVYKISSFDLWHAFKQLKNMFLDWY